MIESLSHWLEKIILLILLATFLDMLLPNTSLQRYVKLVMGLLVLLTMITPVIQLFHSGMDAEKLATQILSMNNGERGDTMSGVKDMEALMLKDHQQEAAEVVRGQLESMIKEKVEKKFKVSVTSVKVTFDAEEGSESSDKITKQLDRKQEYPVISTVQLVLDKDIQGTSHGLNNEEVKPIKPVTIDVSGEPKQADAMAATSEKLSIAQRKLLTDIADDIAHTLDIDREKIDAKLVEKPEEG